MIRSAKDDEMDAVRELFREYARLMEVDLCFQGFEAELAALPGKYAEPEGTLFVHDDNGELTACVAVRPCGDGWAEMKRLFVRPAARGGGVGRKMAVAAMEAAKAKGYAGIRLDSISGKMDTAIAMYRSLGFVSAEAYYENPLPGVCYLQLPFSNSAEG